MANFNMDLTGSDPNYKRSDQLFKIFKSNQMIDFGTVVFESSIRVFLIYQGVADIQLTHNVDFRIPAAFRSTTDNATSDAKIVNSAFNESLVSGIEMIRTVDTENPYSIVIEYQGLYPNQLATTYHHGVPLTVTPELVLDIVRSVEQLKIVTSQVADVSSIVVGGAIVLPIDESKTNMNNYIVEEIHALKVPDGRFIIHPKGGSFYEDSITVYHPATNTTLQRGIDYQIVGMDEAKTKATSHTAPVYKFVLVLAPIVDDVKVSYHAFGGDPTADNYRELLLMSNNVIQYLNDAKTLTESTLPSTTTITQLFDNYYALEARMRRLEGTPAYGDITSGKSILMKLFSDEPGMHWFTIASLYKTAGNTSPVTADTFIFRLQSKISHFQFKVAVSVDLGNDEGERFNINVISENYPRGFISFKDYANINSIIRPQLRVVWKDTNTPTGAYLQLGFELKGMLEETIAIEDMSGHESCWQLVDEIAGATVPKDDDFMLPNNIDMWSSHLDTCIQESQLVPFTKGHLVWAGMQPMNAIDGWQHFEVKQGVDLLLGDCNISKFSKLRVNVEEEAGLTYPIDIQFNQGTEHPKGHSSFTHQEKPVYINAEVYRQDGLITLRINYDVTAGLESNPLTIRDMIIYS